MADNGPNAFDLVRLFLGDAAVTAARIERDAAGIDRRASITLTGGAQVELDWSYDRELKDIEVELVDGTVHRADMLAGYRGFKESLWHEYAGILAKFVSLLDRTGGERDDGGLAALELVESAYHLETAHRPVVSP